jgi:hypothetical protein
VSEAWIERELARQLRPVAAPADLWGRIEERRALPRERSFGWSVWPIAAALMLVAGSAVVWRLVTPRSIEEMAMRELRDTDHLDFRCDDPEQIRRWVKAKAGIDIELPGKTGVRLLGARMMERQGSPIAAIAYRVAGGAAALLVSRRSGDSGGRAHRFAPAGSARGARIFSWTMREQEYTIACSVTREPEVACLLCHSQPQTTLN